MAQKERMFETMRKIGISEGILSQFDCTEQNGNRPESIIEFISLMDKLLTKEQCLAVMEREGCCKTGERDRKCKAFGKEHKEKPLAEKLSLWENVHQYIWKPTLNDDGTFTITWQGYQNGKHTGKTTCSCGTIKKLKQPFSVSRTYCGCCAGHFMYHYQNALGVSLRLKEINSSPLATNCEQPCSFTFEVI